MTEIKRYEMNHRGLPSADYTGTWVKHEDHAAIVAALQEQVRALAAEVSVVKAAVEQHANCFSSCPSCGHEEPSETDDVVWIVRKIETPATDAALREIRAKELDVIADELSALDTVGSTGAIACVIRQKAVRIRSGEQP